MAGLDRVCVTGASGFVGTILCRRLLERGTDVTGIVRKDGASPFPDNAHYRQIAIGDIGPATDWAVALADVQTFFHLAARVHVMHDTSANPLTEFRQVNTLATTHLAREAAANGVKRLVYVSTIKVNGEETHDGSRFAPSDVPAPQDPYAISKWEAEQELHRIAGETGLEVVVVRPPLVYGPDVKGNFAQMLSAVARSFPLPFTSATNMRSLVYVENLVDALIACATHPAAVGQTYLISDGEDVSTPDLLSRLATALGVSPRLFPFPLMLLRLAGTLVGKTAQLERLLGSLQVDSDKIRRELNWVPPYTLQQGLQATADWYRNRQHT